MRPRCSPLSERGDQRLKKKKKTGWRSRTDTHREVIQGLTRSGTHRHRQFVYHKHKSTHAQGIDPRANPNCNTQPQTVCMSRAHEHTRKGSNLLRCSPQNGKGGRQLKKRKKGRLGVNPVVKSSLTNFLTSEVSLRQEDQVLATERKRRSATERKKQR